MSNVPDDFHQYTCHKCGETPCDCRDYCEECGEELDNDGNCPECDHEEDDLPEVEVGGGGEDDSKPPSL